MKCQDIDHKPLRSLLDLPNELLCQVSTHLQTGQDISSFAQVNSQLYRLTIAHLYQFNAQHSASSALLWAGTRGRISTAQRALKERLNIEQPKASTPSIEAALVLAAENNHKDMVRLLVESGARPNWGDYERRQNAMEVAAKAGHVRIVQLLLGLGANPGAGFRLKPYAIQVAAREGHTEIVRLLIDAGQSPDSCSGRPGGGSFTPLQEAAKTNNVELAKLLFSKGVRINYRSVYYMTPLELAVRGNHMEMVRLLLDAGAKVYNHGRRSVPGMIKERGRKEMRELLKNEAVQPWSNEDGHDVARV